MSDPSYYRGTINFFLCSKRFAQRVLNVVKISNLDAFNRRGSQCGKPPFFVGGYLWCAKRGVNFRNYGRVPPDSRVDPRRLFSVVSPVDMCGSYASLSFERCVFETRSLTGLPLEQGSKSRWNAWVTARTTSVCSRLKPSGPGTGEPVTALVRISKRYGTCKVGGFSNESHLCSLRRLVCCGAWPRPDGRRQPGGGRRCCAPAACCAAPAARL